MNGGDRILIVDDDIDTLRMLRILLTRTGYQVMAVTTLELAIECAQSGNYNFLITDYLLPDGTAIDLLEQITAKNPGIRGFVCSGVDCDLLAEKCMAAGYSGYLCKPISFTELLDLVDAGAPHDSPLFSTPLDQNLN